MTFAAVLKLLPFAVIAALVVALGLARMDAISINAKLDAMTAQAAALAKANETSANTIKLLGERDAANDKIIADLATNLGAIRQRGDAERVALKEATRNDPASRDWAVMPVPARVRAALEAPRAR